MFYHYTYQSRENKVFFNPPPSLDFHNGPRPFLQWSVRFPRPYPIGPYVIYWWYLKTARTVQYVRTYVRVSQGTDRVVFSALRFFPWLPLLLHSLLKFIRKVFQGGNLFGKVTFTSVLDLYSAICHIWFFSLGFVAWGKYQKNLPDCACLWPREFIWLFP